MRFAASFVFRKNSRFDWVMSQSILAHIPFLCVSSLVLARIVTIIQEELAVRADERKHLGDFGNDGSGSRS